MKNVLIALLAMFLAALVMAEISASADGAQAATIQPEPGVRPPITIPRESA